MRDEPFERLLDYHRRRYWLLNGWSLRFRVIAVEITEVRPHGIRYSLTLHDTDGTRLLGFDNAHGIPRQLKHDHQHRFRKTHEVVPYEFRGADELLVDFFAAVERACTHEDVEFAFDDELTDLEEVEMDYVQEELD